MFTYLAFYRGRSITVQALRSYDAQLAAAKVFKARKAWEVTVMLAADAQGNAVAHSTASI